MMVALIGAMVAGACPDVLDYGSWKPSISTAWDFRSDSATVIGAEHSRDPSHEQFGRIVSAFETARPTLALFEGPDRGVAASREETIRAGGESALARLLAKSAGIPARSLEPSPSDQVKALARAFPQDQVMLFFVLREASRLRDREGLSGEKLDGAVSALLQRAAGIGPMPFEDFAGLDTAFRKYWPDRDWRTAEARWFDPLAEDAATGGKFFAAINRANSTNRNRHLVKLLANFAAKGERVFVVVGRNHVPMIAPALECALAGPKTVGR
ncbi:MAG: hypothetical protein HOP96_11540 [Sphingomonas sp.]|nr:hypothetical protein [Sphingomonas sp.]